MIKAAAREQLPVVHPENPGIAGITIAQLSGPSPNPNSHRKNTVVAKFPGECMKGGREWPD